MNTLKGTFYLTISSLVFMLSSYTVNIWLGRTLGPDGYGIYGVIISLMTVINIIQTSGLPQAVSKFTAEGIENPKVILKSGLQLQLISTLTISIIFFLLAGPLASLLKDLSLVPYIRFSSLVLPTYSLFALYTGFYNGQHRFGKQALINIIYSVAKLLGVIVFVYFFHLYGAILSFILAPIIALLFGFSWPSAFRVFPYRKLIIFSLPLIGFAIVSSLPLFLDLFFVKSIMKNDFSTGLYNATENIADIIFYGLSAFALVLFPSISRLVASANDAEVKQTIESALRVIIIILVPLVAILSGGSRQVLHLLYSNSYLGAATALSVLVVGIAFLTLFNLQANALNGSGRTRFSLIYSLIGIGIIAGLCLILIPKFGILGAAIATTLGSLAAFVFSSITVGKIFGAGFRIKTLLKVIILSAVIYFVVLTVSPSIWVLPIFYAGIFLIYLFVLYLIREITNQDLSLVRTLFRK